MLIFFTIYIFYSLAKPPSILYYTDLKCSSVMICAIASLDGDDAHIFTEIVNCILVLSSVSPY